MAKGKFIRYEVDAYNDDNEKTTHHLNSNQITQIVTILNAGLHIGAVRQIHCDREEWEEYFGQKKGVPQEAAHHE